MVLAVRPYDDSDEEVECEEGSDDDEEDIVEVVVDLDLPLRLIPHIHRVDRVVHYVHPALQEKGACFILVKYGDVYTSVGLKFLHIEQIFAA